MATNLSRLELGKFKEILKELCGHQVDPRKNQNTNPYNKDYALQPIKLTKQDLRNRYLGDYKTYIAIKRRIDKSVANTGRFEQKHGNDATPGKTADILMVDLTSFDTQEDTTPITIETDVQKNEENAHPNFRSHNVVSSELPLNNQSLSTNSESEKLLSTSHVDKAEEKEEKEDDDDITILDFKSVEPFPVLKIERFISNIMKIKTSDHRFVSMMQLNELSILQEYLQDYKKHLSIGIKHELQTVTMELELERLKLENHVETVALYNSAVVEDLKEYEQQLIRHNKKLAAQVSKS